MKQRIQLIVPMRRPSKKNQRLRHRFVKNHTWFSNTSAFERSESTANADVPTRTAHATRNKKTLRALHSYRYAPSEIRTRATALLLCNGKAAYYRYTNGANTPCEERNRFKKLLSVSHALLRISLLRPLEF